MKPVRTMPSLPLEAPLPAPHGPKSDEVLPCPERRHHAQAPSRPSRPASSHAVPG